MKTTALDSKPERQLAKGSRARAGRFDSATPSPVACSAFTYCVLLDQFNESVDAIACTAPSCTSIDHRNQQYSIYALSDSSGNVSERYAYTAYGQPTFLNASATVQTSSASGNRYTFTAREWDQTIGLHHFRARWMNGAAGRFLSRDPIKFMGSEWDLYEFLGAHLMVSLDPHGLATVTCDCTCRQGRGMVLFTEMIDTNCEVGAPCCQDVCNYTKCVEGFVNDRCGKKWPTRNCYQCGGYSCPHGQRQMMRYEAEFGGRFDQCASAYWRHYRELGVTLFCIIYVKEPRAQALCLLAVNSYPAAVCTQLVCATPGESPNPPMPGSPNY